MPFRRDRRSEDRHDYILTGSQTVWITVRNLVVAVRIDPANTELRIVVYPLHREQAGKELHKIRLPFSVEPPDPDVEETPDDPDNRRITAPWRSS